jgi:hypothetical protein
VTNQHSGGEQCKCGIRCDDWLDIPMPAQVVADRSFQRLPCSRVLKRRTRIGLDRSLPRPVFVA